MFHSPQSALHMIGNAHIDPAWLWRWPDGCAEAIGTCWAAIDRLEEDSGFIFTRGEAVIYQWIEELEPALFQRIQHYVHEGRWVIVNGWWLQPDCNLPDGEAFIRQSLYGKSYFREKFGIDVTVGYNVDSFGHAATLPMLLHHTGFSGYVFMRPGRHEKELPSALFDWVSPDGSRVSAFRIEDEYQTGHMDMEAKVGRATQRVTETGLPLMCFYGVGNHGGGPTRENLAIVHRFQDAGQAVIFSDPVRYFAATAHMPRPEVHDELQMHAIGCYAAVSTLKYLNRRAEGRLAQAEAASALALLHAHAEYPFADLRRLWNSLLFNQFHDILGGTCIPSATRDASEVLSSVVQGAEELLNASLRRLAATVKPVSHPEDATFLVFNLTGDEQQNPFEYEPWLGAKHSAQRLLDDVGNEIAYQEIPAEAYTQGMRRFVFTPRVPPFGYRLYRFASGVPSVVASTLQTSQNSIENTAWRLEIDAETGGIAHLTDKRARREVFAGTAHLPVMVDDTSDTWSHGLESFGILGQKSVCEQVECIEQGPLRACLRVHLRIGVSTVTTTYVLYNNPDLPLEMRVKINWQEQQRLLRLCYPVACSAPTFRYEVPAGSLERPSDGREYPGLRWALVKGSDGYGLALANDAKYSYAAQDNTLYITALRSPAYAHHFPYQLQPDQEYVYTDQGVQEFTLRLLAGATIKSRDAHLLADELLRPLIATPHTSRGGTGEHCASLFSVQANSSLVTWLKAAEDKAGLVVRLLEIEGAYDQAVVSPGDHEYIQTLPPYGVVTLRSNHDGQWQVSSGLED